MKTIVFILLFITITGCVVMPEVDHSQKYQCALSSDKKYLKVVNIMDGNTNYYAWQDEMLSIISFPTSAEISSVYVAVNNIYHFGEQKIKCDG